MNTLRKLTLALVAAIALLPLAASAGGREIHSVIRCAASIEPAVYTSDQTGDSIDTAGFNAVEVVFYIGDAGDTWSSTDKIGLEILSSSDDGDADAYAAVTSTKILGTLPELDSSSADDLQIYRFGVVAGERYIKPKFNFSGTHATGSPMSAFVILGEPNDAPTDNP